MLQSADGDANETCLKLAYSSHFLKTIEQDIKSTEQINYCYLDYNQLVNRLHGKDNKIKQLTSQIFNDDRKIRSVIRNIGIHKHIFHCIQDNNINKLSEIIKVCLNKQKYGLCFTKT